MRGRGRVGAPGRVAEAIKKMAPSQLTAIEAALKIAKERAAQKGALSAGE